MRRELDRLFDLSGKVAVITGGAGLLGIKHAEALMEAGAYCVLADINGEMAGMAAAKLIAEKSSKAIGVQTDITNSDSVSGLLNQTLQEFGRVDILINNAANNPHYDKLADGLESRRFETFPLGIWNQDIAVGLTGSFLCSQIIGSHLAQQGQGVILNIASDLALIAPDQRIYKKEDIPPELQPTKPITYSVVKSGIIGLTRYLATYWADKGVRSNALVPGGVYTNQDEEFVIKLTKLIPLQRMAKADEYKAAVVFLCSEASSYMTGAALVIDGGRTCW